MTNLSPLLALVAGAALLMAAGASSAADTVPADAPVATAQGPARSVAEQIDEYLASSPAIALPRDPTPGVIPSQEEYERQIHGEVSVAIGTGGYRSAYIRSDIPVGKTGTVSIALSETKGRGYHSYGYGGYGGYGAYNGFGYGPGYGYAPYGDSRSVGIGLSLPGAAASPRPGGRDFAAGCGRSAAERRVGGINELVLSPRRGACDERWMDDPLAR
jgi:hypothetical protein